MVVCEEPTERNGTLGTDEKRRLVVREGLAECCGMLGVRRSDGRSVVAMTVMICVGNG
jgi:hypothetical protein